MKCYYDREIKCKLTFPNFLFPETFHSNWYVLHFSHSTFNLKLAILSHHHNIFPLSSTDFMKILLFIKIQWLTIKIGIEFFFFLIYVCMHCIIELCPERGFFSIHFIMRFLLVQVILKNFPVSKYYSGTQHSRYWSPKNNYLVFKNFYDK